MFDDWPDSSGKIHPEEFECPDGINLDMVKALGRTRRHLERPMYLTQSREGVVYHPHGDAVPPHCDSHSAYSLHRYGIEHALSREKDSLIVDPKGKGLAQDWDCRVGSAEELFDIYLEIERLNIWGGIGLYPDWQFGGKFRPGFHTDLRPRMHPDFGARWFARRAGKKQEYYPLTWPLWKEVML